MEETQQQINDAPHFQHRFWRVQRVAWIGYGVIIVLALLGLTGMGGPLSRASMEAGGNRIDFPRVSRWQATDLVKVEFAPNDAETRRIVLSRQFVEAFSLEDIQPQPDSSRATDDGVEMSFVVEPQSTGNVDFHVRSETPGISELVVQIDEARASSFLLTLP